MSNTIGLLVVREAKINCKQCYLLIVGENTPSVLPIAFFSLSLFNNILYQVTVSLNQYGRMDDTAAVASRYMYIFLNIHSVIRLKRKEDAD